MDGDLKLEYVLRMLYETNMAITDGETAANCHWAKSCYRIMEMVHESNADEMELAFGLKEMRLEGCPEGCEVKGDCKNKIRAKGERPR